MDSWLHLSASCQSHDSHCSLLGAECEMCQQSDQLSCDCSVLGVRVGMGPGLPTLGLGSHLCEETLHPILMTGDCAWLCMELVHTSQGRPQSALHRGPVRFWLCFRPEVRQKFGPDSSLKWRTGMHRTPAVSRICIKCEPSLGKFTVC